MLNKEKNGEFSKISSTLEKEKKIFRRAFPGGAGFILLIKIKILHMVRPIYIGLKPVGNVLMICIACILFTMLSRRPDDE